MGEREKITLYKYPKKKRKVYVKYLRGGHWPWSRLESPSRYLTLIPS